MRLTLAPARAAATAWFEPLPPGPILKPEPISVSPMIRLAVGAKGQIGDEDAEDRNALFHRQSQAFGGITPFLRMKQP